MKAVWKDRCFLEPVRPDRMNDLAASSKGLKLQLFYRRKRRGMDLYKNFETGRIFRASSGMMNQKRENLNR